MLNQDFEKLLKRKEHLLNLRIDNLTQANYIKIEMEKINKRIDEFKIKNKLTR